MRIKFKVGERLKCIANSRDDEYHVHKGDVLVVKSIGNAGVFHSTEEQSRCHHTSPCYRTELFIRYVPKNIVGGKLI